MKVGVSFLKSDISAEETIRKIDESSADYIHVDVMDGQFVPEANYTPSDIKALTKNCNKKLDVHLMVCSPNKYIKEYAKMKNIEYLTIHYESHRKPIDVINMIRHVPFKAGIAINPDTKIHKIVSLLNHVDQVLVMSVQPGKGGQAFMEDVLYKVEALKDIREQNNYHYIIAIDGGINEETVKKAKEAGVDLVISGSYVVCSDNYDERIEKLR